MQFVRSLAMTIVMALALALVSSATQISVAWAQVPATALPQQCAEYSRPTRVRLTRAVPASMLLASAWEGLSDAEASAYLNSGEIPQRFVLLRGFPTTIQPRGLGPVNWLNPGADGVLSDEVRSGREFLRLGELVCANPANTWDAHADLVERFTRDSATEVRLRAAAAGKSWIRVLAANDPARGPVLIRSTQYNVRINCAAQGRLETLFVGYRGASADGSALDSTWALTVRARANVTIEIPRKGSPRLLQRACSAIPRLPGVITSESRDAATDALSDLDGVDSNMDANAELRAAVRTAKDQIKALLRRALRPELNQIAGLRVQRNFYRKLFNRRVDEDIRRQAERSLSIAWRILGSAVFAALLFLVGFEIYRRHRNRGPAPIPAEIAQKAREGLMDTLEDELYQAVFFLRQNVVALGDSEKDVQRQTFIQSLDIGQPIAPQVHDLPAFFQLFRLVAEAVSDAKPTPPTNTTPPTATTPGGGKPSTFVDHAGQERPFTREAFAAALKDAIASTEWRTRVAMMALALGNPAIAISLRATYDRGVADGAAKATTASAAETTPTETSAPVYDDLDGDAITVDGQTAFTAALKAAHAKGVGSVALVMSAVTRFSLLAATATPTIFTTNGDTVVGTERDARFVFTPATALKAETAPTETSATHEATAQERIAALVAETESLRGRLIEAAQEIAALRLVNDAVAPASAVCLTDTAVEGSKDARIAELATVLRGLIDATAVVPSDEEIRQLLERCGHPVGTHASASATQPPAPLPNIETGQWLAVLNQLHAGDASQPSAVTPVSSADEDAASEAPTTEALAASADDLEKVVASSAEQSFTAATTKATMAPSVPQEDVGAETGAYPSVPGGGVPVDLKLLMGGDGREEGKMTAQYGAAAFDPNDAFETAKEGSLDAAGSAGEALPLSTTPAEPLPLTREAPLATPVSAVKSAAGSSYLTLPGNPPPPPPATRPLPTPPTPPPAEGTDPSSPLRGNTPSGVHFNPTPAADSGTPNSPNPTPAATNVA